MLYKESATDRDRWNLCLSAAWDAFWCTRAISCDISQSADVMRLQQIVLQCHWNALRHRSVNGSRALVLHVCGADAICICSVVHQRYVTAAQTAHRKYCNSLSRTQ